MPFAASLAVISAPTPGRSSPVASRPFRFLPSSTPAFFAIGPSFGALSSTMRTISVLRADLGYPRNPARLTPASLTAFRSRAPSPTLFGILPM